MHHIPKPQDQARILKSALKSLNLDLPHQDALQVIANVMGHKNWKTMSAALKNATLAPQTVPAAPVVPHRALEIMGPADGDIYEALVSVDMSLSARVRVRAYDKDDARELLRDAAQQQYPRGFEVDENYRGGADYYLGDSDAIDLISEVSFDKEGDHFGMATWKDENYEYKICMSRTEPDSSDEELRADVEVTLVVKAENGVSVSKTIDDYEVHSDDLAEWIEECLDNEDFEEDFDSLVEELEEKLKLK